MFCPACGVQNDEDSIFCANCGTKFDKSNPQPSHYESESYQNNQYQNAPQKPQYANNQNHGYDKALYQNNPPQSNVNQGYNQQSGTYGTTQYRQPYTQPYGQYPVEDKVNPLLYIAALLFPIGLILYFANRRQKPKSSRNFLIAAFIGFFILL